MARNRLVAKAKLGGWTTHRAGPEIPSRVPAGHGHVFVHFSKEHNVLLEDMECQRSSPLIDIRVCEFHLRATCHKCITSNDILRMLEYAYKNKGLVNSWVIRNLNNRFRSHTQVAIFRAVLNAKLQHETEPIGIRCSGNRKCSQRFEINHFCQSICLAIQPSRLISKFTVQA